MLMAFRSSNQSFAAALTARFEAFDKFDKVSTKAWCRSSSIQFAWVCHAAGRCETHP